MFFLFSLGKRVIHWIFQWVILMSISLCVSVSVWAGEIQVISPVASEGVLPGGEIDSVDIIGNIISWTIGLTAVMAVIAITWAGIQMVLATGEDEKIKKARYMMIYAFIGVIVSGVAYGVVSFITKLNFTL